MLFPILLFKDGEAPPSENTGPELTPGVPAPHVLSRLTPPSGAPVRPAMFATSRWEGLWSPRGGLASVSPGLGYSQ